MNAQLYLEPLDVLVLRGNKLFGDPGSYGESLVPPWPSVAAGAIRSRILADDGVDFAAFARGDVDHPGLGTPTDPRGFRVTGFHLARKSGASVEILVAAPADLVVTENASGAPDARVLNPVTPAAGIATSAPCPMLPALATADRAKPASGYWLTGMGWSRYLAGERPLAGELVASGKLWQVEPRVGIGLEPERRCADDGRLFTVQAVALARDVGFLVGIAGADVPDGGVLRFGGDGRAVAVTSADLTPPQPDYAAIAGSGRCRLALTSPGIFPGGWRLPGMDEHGRFSLGGVSARVVCAAVPRAEVVSGWDLANGCPKAARRAAPTGSVYWMEDLEGTPDQLRALVADGLWEEPCTDPARRAEGFNHCALALWP